MVSFFSLENNMHLVKLTYTQNLIITGVLILLVICTLTVVCTRAALYCATLRSDPPCSSTGNSIQMVGVIVMDPESDISSDSSTDAESSE